MATKLEIDDTCRRSIKYKQESKSICEVYIGRIVNIIPNDAREITICITLHQYPVLTLNRLHRVGISFAKINWKSTKIIHWQKYIWRY